MWFEIDFKRLATLLLPVNLRKQLMMAWLRSLLSPLQNLHYKFVQKRNKDWFILKHNGQVCYLRGALNAEFDPMQKRIKIIEDQHYVREYIYTRPEEKPRYLGTIYLHDRVVYNDAGPDFYVMIPEDLAYDAYQMRAFINQFKLATKTYKIMSYE